MAVTPEEFKVLAKFKKEFLADFRNETEWRKDIWQYARYYDGDQWTEEERKILEDRGQPVVEINRIKPKMDSIFGIQQGLRVDTKIFPQGTRELDSLDPQVQALIQEMSERLRQIEDQSDLDEQENTVFEDEAIDGLGWYHIKRKFEGPEDSFKTLWLVEHVYNRDLVRDRFSRRMDYSDAKRLSHTVWMDLEDAQAIWPNKKEDLKGAAFSRGFLPNIDEKFIREFEPDQYLQPDTIGFREDDFSEFIDTKRRRVRIVTTYHRTMERRRYFWASGLDKPEDVTDASVEEIKKIQEAHVAGQLFTDEVKKLNSFTFTWNTPLEEFTDLRSFDRQAKFPYVPVYGYRDRRSFRPYGIVKQMISPQDEVNKRRSKALHLLNSNRVLFQKGAFDNPEVAKVQINRPDTFLAFKKGFSVDIQQNQELGQAQFSLYQEAKRELDTAGVNRELEGQSSARSGRDFQLRQQAAMQSIRKLFVNLRIGRREVGKYLMEQIIQDMTLENPQLKGVLSAFEVIVEEAPDSLNLQSETFDQLIQLATSGVQIPPDLLADMAPLSAKAKTRWKEFMQQQQQQQQPLPAAQRGQQPTG